MVGVSCVDGTPAEDKAVINLPPFLGSQDLPGGQEIWQGGSSIGCQGGVGGPSWGGQILD